MLDQRVQQGDRPAGLAIVERDQKLVGAGGALAGVQEAGHAPLAQSFVDVVGHVGRRQVGREGRFQEQPVEPLQVVFAQLGRAARQEFLGLGLDRDLRQRRGVEQVADRQQLIEVMDHAGR